MPWFIVQVPRRSETPAGHPVTLPDGRRAVFLGGKTEQWSAGAAGFHTRDEAEHHVRREMGNPFGGLCTLVEATDSVQAILLAQSQREQLETIEIPVVPYPSLATLLETLATGEGKRLLEAMNAARIDIQPQSMPRRPAYAFRVGNGNLLLHEFPGEDEATAYAESILPDGSGRRMPDGRVSDFGRRSPPVPLHFCRAGRIVVRYDGDNGVVLSTLQEHCGPPVAGHD